MEDNGLSNKVTRYLLELFFPKYKNAVSPREQGMMLKFLLKKEFKDLIDTPANKDQNLVKAIEKRISEYEVSLKDDIPHERLPTQSLIPTNWNDPKQRQKTIRFELGLYVRHRSIYAEYNDDPYIKIISEEYEKWESQKLPKKIDKNLTVFSSSLKDVISSIASRTTVEGVNLIEKLQDPQFKFMTTDEPEVSLELSKAFNALAGANTQSLAKQNAELSAKARVKNAEEYAKKLFEVVEEMKKEHGNLTIQKTIELLNSKGVETANGGQWRINSIQSLQKRWKELGLGSDGKPN